MEKILEKAFGLLVLIPPAAGVMQYLALPVELQLEPQAHHVAKWMAFVACFGALVYVLVPGRSHRSLGGSLFAAGLVLAFVFWIYNSGDPPAEGIHPHALAAIWILSISLLGWGLGLLVKFR